MEFFPFGTLPFGFHHTGIKEETYLIARHPIGIQFLLNIFFSYSSSLNVYADTRRIYTNFADPYDKILWLSFGASILSIGLVTLVFVKLCPDKIHPATDETFLMIRVFFGFTEPENIDYLDHARNFTG